MSTGAFLVNQSTKRRKTSYGRLVVLNSTVKTNIGGQLFNPGTSYVFKGR